MPIRKSEIPKYFKPKFKILHNGFNRIRSIPQTSDANSERVSQTQETNKNHRKDSTQKSHNLLSSITPVQGENQVLIRRQGRSKIISKSLKLTAFKTMFRIEASPMKFLTAKLVEKIIQV